MAKKVASYVSSIDSEIKGVRDSVTKAFSTKLNLTKTIQGASFWAPFPAWYSDKIMKGWEFNGTVPLPKDYGFAKWRKRQVEAVVAKVRVLMKNRTLGEYSDDCWYFGYIYDTEFSMKREPFVSRCKDEAKLAQWKIQHYFDTRWVLGVQ